MFEGWCRVCGLEYHSIEEWLAHRYEHEAQQHLDCRLAATLLPREPRSGRG